MTPETGDLLNAVLRVEHAAIYHYGVVGARLGSSARAQALAFYDEHRAHRDVLHAAVLAAGGTPDVGELSYAPPAPLGPGSAGVLLAVEEALAAAYHDAITMVFGAAERRLLAEGFVDEARHAALWRFGMSPHLAAASEAFVTGRRGPS